MRETSGTEMQKKDVADDWDWEDRKIKIHDAAAYDGMRKAGKLAAETLDFITPHVVPGVTTDELDRLCHSFIVGHGAIPAPLNYRGFPRSICTRSTRLRPPRGTMTSMAPSRPFSISPTAARSVVGTSEMAAFGRPATRKPSTRQA